MLGFKNYLLVSAAALLLTAGCSSTDDPTAGKVDDVEADESDDRTPARVDAGKKDAGSKDAGKRDAGKRDIDEPTPDESVPEQGEPESDEDAADMAAPQPGKADAGKPSPLDASVAASGENLPCNIAKIVNDKCLLCHGEERASGVTFSLTSLHSFHEPSQSDSARPVHEVAYERVTATEKKMPPASTVDISAAEQKLLADWLKAGAKGSSDKCDTEPTPVDAGVTPPVSGGSGGASIAPIAYDDPLLKCYQFKAFASGDKSKPYSVGTRPDFYVAFNINPEFKGTQYLRSFRTLIDNKDVIHHWLFFKQAARGAEGVTENAIGAHPDGELIAGWAPGGDDLYFDPDTAMEITGDTTYQLEAHYNNKTGSAKPDASGIEICVTPTKPKILANVSWLGTDSISSTQAVGTCTPTNRGPVNLIAGSPHMHIKGRHMKVVINRKGGTKQVIHDEDFDFEYQKQYLLNGISVMPGDTITTTCTYSGPARFGKGTNDEMCYFFTTHSPAGSLVSTGLGSVIHGPNSCLN
jgi:hypothetical protein